MSYREQRNITDLLRRMGYPRLVSHESFRQPNFLLVADILRWFMKRYDPSIEILRQTDTEQQRVTFIRSFVQHMLRKAGLKLNPKRLYQSDGYAVKEITKVIQFFTNVTKEVNEMKTGTGTKDVLTQFYEYQPTLHKIRMTRDLASTLTEESVEFFDLITKEITNRTFREAILSKPFDLKDYEHIIRKGIAGLRSEELKLQANLEAGESTILALNTKVEKKRQELERSEQRLETMTKVRPAYMDEFEKLQHELEILYDDYVTRFRVLSHLQHQMDEMTRNEELRRIENKSIKARGRDGFRSKTADDELSGSEIDEDEEESQLDDSLQQNAREVLLSRGGVGKTGNQEPRPIGTAKNGMSLGGRGTEQIGMTDVVMPNRIKSSRATGKGAGGVNMYGTALEDDEDDDSESDLLLLEGDNSDLGSDIDEEADLVMSIHGGPYGKSDHISRREGQDFKQNGSGALNLLNGNEHALSEKLQRPIPPAPTGSRHNLESELGDEDLEYYRDGVVANGIGKGMGDPYNDLMTNSLGEEISGDGDSPAQPLRPEPRYNTNGSMGPDLSHTLVGRPSTKHKSKRASSGTTSKNERPSTRGSSRAKQLLKKLKDDDDF